MHTATTTKRGRGDADLKSVQFWLDRSDHIRLKVLAAKLERPVQEVVLEAVRKYLATEGRAA